MGFVPASHRNHNEYGHTAALLLQMADEMGLDPHVVKTVTGGFEVPDAISVVLNPPPPELEPPTWWKCPAPEVDVETAPDGRVLLTDAGKERLLAQEEPVIPNENLQAAARAAKPRAPRKVATD